MDYQTMREEAFQLINQSNFYSANIPSIARLSGTTARSVFKSEVDEVILYHQQAVMSVGVYREKAKSKRCFETSPEGST